MATSTIERGAHFGARSEISSFPFIAPTDGIVTIHSDPNEATLMQDIFSIAGDRKKGILNFSTSGVKAISSVPIKSGETLAIFYTENVKNREAWFIPLEGGGKQTFAPCNVAQVAA